MRYYVIINGVNSLTIKGMAISSLPSISKPLMRTSKEEIDGRDGDIITKLGYSAYDKTLKIGLYGNYEINEIISYFNQEGTITFSNEPDKYYNFTIVNREDFINELDKFKTASITLHCQPYKYPLEEQPVVLDNDYQTQTGTSMTFINSIQAKMKDISLKGNTSQKTLSGKNLFDLSITQYGKAWNNSSNVNLAICYTPCLPNTAYTISYSGVSDIEFTWIEKESAEATTRTYLSGFSGTRTFTTTSTTNVICIQMNKTNISVNDTKNLKMQIELGSTATSYEQYCGGVPSPNPDYPQHVNVVSGDNQIVVCGKNLFDKDNANVLNVYFNQGGVISYNNARSIYMPCLPNTTYTIKKNGSVRFRVGTTNVFPDNNVSIIDFAQQDSDEPITINTSNNASYLIVYLYLTSDTNVKTFEQVLSTLQIEESNQATTYEAYNGTTYNIDLPVENLFDKNTNNTGFSESSTISTINNGLKITCTTSGTYRWYAVPLSNTNTLLGKKITITTDMTVSNNQNGQVALYFINKNNYSLGASIGSSGAKATGKITLSVDVPTTIPSGNTDIGLLLYSGLNQTSVNDYVNYDNIQIEVGSNSNTYTPYGTTPIELCKISTYQDYFYKQGNKWYLHKEIGKIVLDGSETYTLVNTNDGNSMYRTDGIITNIGDNINYYSNYFLPNTAAYGTSTIGSYITNNQFRMRVPSTITNIKTWLVNNNTSIYYILTTPTNTEITDTTLKTQLDNILNAQSKQGQTNITQINNDEAFIITTSVLCGGTTMIVNNLGNTYSKPKMTIYGSGDITISLNGLQIFSVAIGEDEYITLDIENMEAYKNAVLKNRQVVGDYSQFKLLSGENTISFTGNVEDVEIENYSRWL